MSNKQDRHKSKWHQLWEAAKAFLFQKNKRYYKTFNGNYSTHRRFKGHRDIKLGAPRWHIRQARHLKGLHPKSGSKC